MNSAARARASAGFSKGKTVRCIITKALFPAVQIDHNSAETLDEVWGFSRVVSISIVLKPLQFYIEYQCVC